MPSYFHMQFAFENGMAYIETSAKTGYNVNKVSNEYAYIYIKTHGSESCGQVKQDRLPLPVSYLLKQLHSNRVHKNAGIQNTLILLCVILK